MSATTKELTRIIDGIPVPAAGRWIIDGSHTSAEFVARHLMVTKVRGSFGAIGGRSTWQRPRRTPALQ